MLTLADFRTRYPEFSKVGDPRVQLALDDAATMVSGDVLGFAQNLGHGLMAAHILAVQPYGREAGLKTVLGETAYGREWLRVADLFGSGKAPII